MRPRATVLTGPPFVGGPVRCGGAPYPDESGCVRWRRPGGQFAPGPVSSRSPVSQRATDCRHARFSSARLVSDLGEREWRTVLGRHHTLVPAARHRFRGTEIITAGDGFSATFDGPARAIRCALFARDDGRDLGLEIRADVHAGEVELIDGDIGGIGVHIGARVAGQAGSGEVLVSRTVKDLVAGSGIAFADRGLHHLKGVPDEWRLFAAG